MYKILFICHGNICRSPMAEYILKDMINDEKLDIYVESCATSSEEIGNTIYPKAKSVLHKHGIKFEDRKARKIKESDYEEFDLLVAMDEENIRNLKKNKKVHKLMEFSEGMGDVDDPWWTGDFDKAYKQISDGCKGIIKYVKEHTNKL